MSSDLVYEVIEQIADRSSKLDKESMLRAAGGSACGELLKRVLEYTYDPFKVYGIRKRPALIGSNGANEFDAGTWELLDDLIARRLTGNAAIEAVRGEMTALSRESSELFWRIIKKDIRAGFSENTIEKVFKGLVPRFPYMRCGLPKDAKWDKFDFPNGAFSQLKADGMFANVDLHDNGDINVTTRQGSPFALDQLEALEESMKIALVPNHQHHGEMLVLKDGIVLPREIGNGILNSIIAGGSLEPGHQVIYVAWDCIPLSAVKTKGKHEEPYAKRFARLHGAIKTGRELGTGNFVRVIETRIVKSLDEAYAHYAEQLGKGLEGTIIKSRHAIWRDGNSKEQIKLKLEVDVDLKIVGIAEGNEGTKNEGRPGAFNCESACGQLKVDVTVKNEALRDAVEANPDDFIGRILVVRANQVMTPSESNEFHSLFLPRMAETSYRTDKTEADDLQRIKDQFDAAVNPA